MLGLSPLHQQVELAGRDPPVVGVDRLLERWQELVHAEPGLGADLEDGRIGEEPESVSDIGGDLGPGLGVEQLPLVEHDHDRTAGGIDALGQALILMGDAVGGIDDQHGRVGPIDRLQSPYERVVLGALVDTRLPAHPGGVDEAQRAVRRFDDRVDGVSRRTGHVVHDRTLIADQPIEQRRLPDVRPPDDGNSRHPICLCLEGFVDGVLGGLFGQTGDDEIEHVARPPAVKGTDGDGIAETEAGELPDLQLAAVGVDLVDDHEHIGADATKELRNAIVLVGDAHRGVDDQQDDVGIGDRSLRLLAHLAIEGVLGGQPPAGVDQRELATDPLGVDRLAVTSDARSLLDDRLLRSRDPVHEGRLADVRATNDGDGRFASAHDVGSSAARRECPSVVTTSTGLGRSSSDPPSMKVPCERQTSGSRYRWPEGSTARALARSIDESRPVTAMFPPK